MKRYLFVCILFSAVCLTGCSLLSGSLKTNDYLMNKWQEKIDKDKLIYDYSICNWMGECILYAVYDYSDGYEYEVEFNESNTTFDQSNYSVYAQVDTTEFIVFLGAYLRDYKRGGLDSVPEEYRIDFETDNYLWKCKQENSRCLLALYDKTIGRIYYYSRSY